MPPPNVIPPGNDRQPAPSSAPFPAGSLVVLGNAPDSEIIASLRRVSSTIRWASTVLLFAITGPAAHPYILQRRALHFPGSSAQSHTQIFADIAGILPFTCSPTDNR